MSIKQNPVAWLTALVAMLSAGDGALEAAHVLSPAISADAGLAIGLLTAILGVVTHGKVTPVANPHDNGGRPLVPLSK